MYHPTRGGVRGGRDQFSWDDVKVDKHRENYVGHSIKAPVGRWQKGKDLHWYTRDKKSQQQDMDAAKEEIRRIKEEEEQAMREALGLAPKRAPKPQGTRLDKHEFSELVKRGSTAEDLGAGHSEATRVDGLGFSKLPKPWEEPSSPSGFPPDKINGPVENVSLAAAPPMQKEEEESEDERSQKKRRREEKRREKDESREKRYSQDTDDRRKQSRDLDDRRKRSRDSDDKRKHTRESDDRRKHKKDKERRRRHDSDSE